MTSGAGSETPRTVLRLAGCDGGDAEPELIQRRLLPAEVPLFDRRDPVAAQRRLGKPRQGVGKLARGRKRGTGLAHPIGQPDPLRLLAGNATPRQDQVHRPAVANQTRQPHGAEVHQRHAEAPAIDAEGRIARGDPHVAPQGQFEATSHGVAFDRRDHRLAELEAARPHRGIAALDAVPSPSRRRFLEIESGAEGALRAGEDRNRQRVIRVEATEAFGQRARRRRIDGIARMRPVDGDDRNGAISFVMHKIRFGHAGSFRPSRPARKRNRGFLG